MLLAGSEMIATVIDEFVAAYPNAYVRMSNGNAEDMLRYLRTGDVDVVIGLLRQNASDGFVQQILADTPYVVVAREDHPLVNKANVTLEDLADYDWIVGTPGATRRTHFDKLFEGRRRPQARIATCSLPTVRLLLAQSDRLTLLTSYELLVYGDDALRAVPFGPMTPVPSLGLTMREGWLPTKLQSDFIDLVNKRIVGSLMPEKALRRLEDASRPPRKLTSAPTNT
jgi:DNA-binding transcriptional LysR family regulator